MNDGQKFPALWELAQTFGVTGPSDVPLVSDAMRTVAREDGSVVSLGQGRKTGGWYASAPGAPRPPTDQQRIEADLWEWLPWAGAGTELPSYKRLAPLYGVDSQTVQRGYGPLMRAGHVLVPAAGSRPFRTGAPFLLALLAPIVWDLREQVSNRTIGDPVATITEMMERHRVSRSTVHRAVTWVRENDGTIDTSLGPREGFRKVRENPALPAPGLADVVRMRMRVRAAAALEAGHGPAPAEALLAAALEGLIVEYELSGLPRDEILAFFLGMESGVVHAALGELAGRRLADGRVVRWSREAGKAVVLPPDDPNGRGAPVLGDPPARSGC